MAFEMGIIDMEVYSDSKLIINQLLNIYEVKKDDLVLFFQHASNLLKDFKSVTLNHIPRKENRMTDALANPATTLALFEGATTNIPMCNQWVLPSVDTFDHEDSNTITIATNNEKEPLHPRVASRPFDAWGLDVVGPITPKSFIGHINIVAATDYFSKWAEAVPLKEVKKETVVDFIRVNIIFRYGVPRYIITDN
ncbi:UNVERIFIED_CONTAM: hypothetical protein Scaly_2030900 [Sesamum calycinum]|uniref:Integrase catalytic domain-containing protein n=1 Tax=Sesamum calycinum TaxID=2727403 RepID=A0AAW2N3E9_9LAMI